MKTRCILVKSWRCLLLVVQQKLRVLYRKERGQVRDKNKMSQLTSFNVRHRLHRAVSVCCAVSHVCL